jgi:YihY family inner membrane protein
MQISLPNTHTRQEFSASDAPGKGQQRIHEFLAKFSHDWTMFSAAGLAYSLMVAVVPIGIAIIAVLGFTVGNLSPATLATVIDRINHAFPSTIASQNVLEPALTKLHSSAGLLAVLAVVLAIFGGSRLFIAIERCFDIIYRTSPRRTLPQYRMALLMMLVFIALTPIMVLASSAPALLLSLLQNSTLSQIPAVALLVHDSFVLSAASVCGGLLVSWMLFQATYMAVPHQCIRLRKSWQGAVVAAMLLELFLAIFPFYVTHFMRSYTGVAGFAIIFLLFFYYFALILLLGAQVNAYFCEHVGPLPHALAVVLQDSMGHHPMAVAASTNPQEDMRTAVDASQASMPSHIRNETITTKEPLSPSQPAAVPSPVAAIQQTTRAAHQQSRFRVPAFLHTRRTPVHVPHPAQPLQAKRRRQGALLPTVVGTALAFGLTFFRLRRYLPSATGKTPLRRKSKKAA